MGLIYALLGLGVLTVVLGQAGGETNLTQVVGGCIALLGCLMVFAAQVFEKPKKGNGGTRRPSPRIQQSGLRDP